MGQTTANMGIYIPSNGETLYGDSFAAGMLNVDLHDHSGPPNKGVPLSSSGLADFSVTAIKLNETGVTAVVDVTSGLGFNGNHQITTTGNLFGINSVNTLGYYVKTGASTAVSRSIVPVSGQTTVTNGNGVAGNTAIGIDAAIIASVPSQINIQTITATGTYTPTSGMIYALVEVIGGGGGGGGCAASPASNVAAGGGGGSGGYSRRFVTAADIGVSMAVTIGAGGTGGAAGNNTGNPGGTTSLGSLIQATGGSQGGGSPTGTVGTVGGSGAGGVGSLGQVNVGGNAGGPGLGFNASGTIFALGGAGAASYLGGSPFQAVNSSAGFAGTAYGAGGGGGCSANGGGAAAGGDGAQGVVIITEYYRTP